MSRKRNKLKLKLKICSVYGDIVEESDMLGNKYYRTTGEKRTGWKQPC